MGVSENKLVWQSDHNHFSFWLYN